MAIIINGMELEEGDFLSQFGEIKEAYCDGVQVWPPPGKEGFFYGGAAGSGSSLATLTNDIVRIDDNGVQKGVTQHAGTPRNIMTGAGLGVNALIHGGYHSSAGQNNILSKINRNNSLIGAEVSIDDVFFGWSGGARSGANAMIHGGTNNYVGTLGSRGLNRRFNETLTSLDLEPRYVGALDACMGCENNGTTNAFFYGRQTTYSEEDGNVERPNTMAIVDVNGVLTRSEYQIGRTSGGAQCGATAVGSVALFYGGNIQVEGGGQLTNATLRVNVTGNTVGSETAVGTARNLLHGSTTNNVGIFYGGAVTGSVTNICTRLNENATIIGSETNVSTVRVYHTSARMSQ